MRLPTSRKRLVLLAAGAVLLAGCSAPRPVADSATVSARAPATAAGGDQVAIDDFAFVPATLTVRAGATVTWTNRDEEPHTVAASDGSFRSPGLGTGATYSRTFSTAGTYDYVCSIHPMMHGAVVVTG